MKNIKNQFNIKLLWVCNWSMKMTYISCIIVEWQLPTVVINGPLTCPNTSGALHTSSCNQGSTVTHKRPFYMTVL